MTIGIYKMQFSDGSVYIGQSNNCPRRKKEHFDSMLAYLHPNKKVRAAFRDHGQPTWTVVQECTLEELNDAEIFYIKQYNSYYKGLNLNRGGGVVRPKKVRIAVNPVQEKINLEMAAAQTAQLRAINKGTDRYLRIVLAIVGAFFIIGYIIAKC